MRRLLKTLSFAVALAMSAASNGRVEANRTRAFADLKLAMEAFDKEDCEAALTAVTRARKSSDFENLETILRIAALQLAAICKTRQGQAALAYRDSLSATAFPESDDYMWRLRLAYELEAKRKDAAVATIEAMNNGRGAALNAIPIRWLYGLDTALRDAKAVDTRRRLLAVLSAESYHPDEPGLTNDGFRFRYAAVLYDAGEREPALRTARGIDNPSLMIDLSLDPRFRSLFATDPDVRAGVEQRLTEMRQVAARNPDHIGPINYIATYLRALGRPREALAALEAIRPAVEGTATLPDRDAQAVWWWDQLSRAHQMAGDYTATIAALKKGGSLQEDGGANVSQVINLSQTQLEFGRAQEALQTLAAFTEGAGRTSPYGEMQVVTTRGCAAARLGKSADVSGDIAFARAHAADAPDALTRLLLCIGNLDGAAASIIARLDDADQRAGALRDLSTFDDPPVTPPPDPVRLNFALVKRRADVQAAIAKSGGVRRFNVQDISF